MARETDELLQVLACELDLRPASAPTAADISKFVTAVTRDKGTLVLHIAEAGGEIVQAFAEAERLCCTDIGWSVTDEPALRLVITASETQVDALAGMIATNNIEGIQ